MQIKIWTLGTDGRLQKKFLVSRIALKSVSMGFKKLPEASEPDSLKNFIPWKLKTPMVRCGFFFSGTGLSTGGPSGQKTGAPELFLKLSAQLSRRG